MVNVHHLPHIIMPRQRCTLPGCDHDRITTQLGPQLQATSQPSTTAAPGRAASRADLEARLPLPYAPTLSDVSLTHLLAAIYVIDAAAMQGSPGRNRDTNNYRGNTGHDHP